MKETFKHFLIFWYLSYCNAVRCHYKQTNSYYIPEALSSNTCEGDVCVYTRMSITSLNDYQFCYRGLHTYDKPDTCIERIDGAIMCLCRTDYCNTVDLPDKKMPDAKVLLSCELDGVNVGVMDQTAMEYCFYKLIKSYDETVEQRIYIRGIFPIPLEDNESNLLRLPYPNSCYNVSTNSYSYEIVCLCGWNFCNKKIPYTIEQGKVKCYLSGDLDKNEFCTGHYCIFTNEAIQSLHGCISLYEEGPFKLEVGLIKGWKLELYVCNSEFCNANANTALASATAFKSSSAYEAYRQSLQQTPTVRNPESIAAQIQFIIAIYSAICLHSFH